MSSFAAKIFKSEHDVCCDCGVQVREADRYCRGSSQEWSALFLCVFVRLHGVRSLPGLVTESLREAIIEDGGITIDFWIIKVHTLARKYPELAHLGTKDQPDPQSQADS